MSVSFIALANISSILICAFDLTAAFAKKSVSSSLSNTIKSLSDSELSLYDIGENERSIFSGDLKNVSSDQFADAYAQALIITGYKIYQKHGALGSDFFFKSLPEIEYAQQDGGTAKVKSFALLEFNKLKNKNLNNR